MLIGVPKEIKAQEFRVGLTPEAVHELSRDGHTVLVESGAGAGIDASDAAYSAAGASVLADALAVYAGAELVVKVKEPMPQECRLLRPGQALFTYLHLAACPEQARLLLASGCTAIAYETVSDAAGGLPLLAPMSEVAGRMAVTVGAVALHKSSGGRGVLLGGVPGVAAAQVVVLGGGTVGSQAARMALGLGAQVVVLDKSLPRLRQLDDQFQGRLATQYATQHAIEQAIASADLVIGAVLIPGASAPKLVSRAMLGMMRSGAVIVDVAIDQGGCFETSRPTTHDAPTYVVDGVVHYAVANMPGAVARTSTYALNNATLPWVAKLARLGWRAACLDDPHLRDGLSICAGHLVHAGAAQSLQLPCRPALEMLQEVG